MQLKQPKPKCLVLLGFHGVGKDTMFRMMEARSHGGLVNAKFGAFNKRLVAEILNVSPNYLEEEPWRSQFNVMQTYGIDGCSLSPLDLVNVLFYGLQNNTKAAANLRQAYVAYTLSLAKNAKVAVFTDVRNQHEMEVIKDNFDPIVVYLWDTNVSPGEGDENVQELAEQHAQVRLHRTAGRPMLTYSELTQLIEQIEEETNVSKL